MVSVTIFAEGGGGRSLNKECRRAFKTFLEGAGANRGSFTIEASGSCANAFKDFKCALSDGTDCLLLVDSEEPLCATTKWGHLSKRRHNKLAKPGKASEDHVYLMVECMEAWFLADTESLKGFFGRGYKESLIPANPEDVPKRTILSILDKMGKAGTKKSYSKGRDSFTLLGMLDAKRVIEVCPHAKELVDFLNPNA